MISLLLLDFILVVLIAAIGFAGGWCAHWHEARRQGKHATADRRVAQEVLAKVHALVDHVSAEMGEHGDYLAEVNEGLAVAVTEETKLVAASLAKLLAANSKMRERLTLAEARLREQSRTIEAHAAEARIDSLTRLVNRRAFDDEMKRGFAAYRRQGRSFSVVLLDLDRFKRWNDRFGYASGDQVLASVAAILRDNAREMDLVGSCGGGQFAVLLPGTALADAVAVAERIRDAVARFECEDEETLVTLSAGVAQVGPEDSVTTLIARADAGLDASKSAGGNGVHYHDGTMIRSAAPASRPGAGDARTAPQEERLTRSGAAGDTGTPGRCAEPPPDPTEETQPGWVGSRGREEEPPYLCARAEFRMTVGRRLAEWRRGGSGFSVVLVRIDEYRSTIEEYGFEIEPCMRSALWHLIVSSTRDMDLVGLQDQETFAMLLPGADRLTAAGAAERLREAVAQRSLTTPGGLLQFRVSTGVAEAREGDEPEQLLGRAEDALLAAVVSGGNVTFVHDGEGPQPCQSEVGAVDSHS